MHTHRLAGLQSRQAPSVAKPPAHVTSSGGMRPVLATKASKNLAETNVSKGFSVLELSNKLIPQSLLVRGVKGGVRFAWQLMVRELAPQTKDGKYARPQYSFNARIGDAAHPVVSGRYRLYLGNACGWCHRVLLALVLRGLAEHIAVTEVLDDATKARRGGWVFDAQHPDPVWGAQDLWEVYDTACPGFKGRCTAPLLVDTVSRTIVSNESSDICRMLNEIHLPGASDVDLYPVHLHGEIDSLNDEIYANINNGVYRSGFATTQLAYDEAQEQLYSTLEAMEARLATTRFLLGDRFTEADLRLYPTISRFDAVYAGIFKCSRKRIADFPNLSGWLRDVYQLEMPGSSRQVRDTVDIDAARRSYYTNLFPLNPSGIVASGPLASDLQLDASHGRASKVASPDSANYLSGTFYLRSDTTQPDVSSGAQVQQLPQLA